MAIEIADTKVKRTGDLHIDPENPSPPRASSTASPQALLTTTIDSMINIELS